MQRVVTLSDADCPTIFLEDAIDADLADWMFNSLRDEVEWEDTKVTHRPSRKAQHLDPRAMPHVVQLIMVTLSKMTEQKYIIHGVYMNYYQDGKMYTPVHRHADTHQLVISLGATRTLKVDKTNYQMTNGSAILFGDERHGVAKSAAKEGRISLATFMSPIEGDKHLIYA